MDDERLWTRTRRAVYDEITRTAMELFLEQGFEQTTIDQISAAAGISRRSFFRYFGTKEDIVLGDLASQGVLVQRSLEAVPLSVPPWEALEQALWQVADLNGDLDAARKVAVMMYGTPSLRARSIEKHLHWQELLVPNIQRRLEAAGGDPLDPAAAAIVASAIACLDIAGQAWLREPGSDLRQLYRRATRAVRG
ncbi:TetR/AcrR family transcriptional regulator [Agromyces larvae]|uniref:TetR/AcrR family transcriptional regulator n=1 Tax=Agromyces larvae TaxID=2929802 RepID=A0ABY4BWK6_9MICO|nr:TetR/AcrR family transcriptional regulator [Agromyces larvae]UOE43611.1 TetR/AcrR family transcriptional regulator [Agromyces larvae]